ncbi:MAG: FAD-dependent oxidoreductase [Actinomycetota bacterium]|nr:FAD-dependent oxidoreductase [Actinomycetota bacterium]MDQ3575155.1 FAD-dependent oxidoreductase [Actinomycetota bacterium]
MAPRYDLVIIGMGSGGMVASEFAASLGLRVAAIERGRVGGDCLWTGCVPSKALLASARVAHHLRTADRWGLPSLDPVEIDTSLVWKRIRDTQAQIATSDDDPERYRGLGVEVVEGTARLVGPHIVDVDGRTLSTRYILVCTGSRPANPGIEGLEEAGYLTSENVFDLERAPRSVVAIGGGPIAIEMAQGLRRLGVGVTVLQRAAGILTRDEPELVAMLAQRLREEGVDLQLGVSVERVTVEDGQKVVRARQGGEQVRFAAADLLVGVGRKPNLEGLGLQAVGVAVGRRGIEVDERMRTNVASIYASGDVAGRYLFTHSAAHEAVRAVRDMFFPGKGVVSELVPWCTFTDPELAHAGLTEAEARRLHGDRVRVRRLDLAHSDRARTDGDSGGRVMAVCGPNDRLLGAHILAPNAGDMIHELAYVISRKGRLSELSKLIHVYPTLSSSIGQLAAESTFDKARRLRWLTKLSRPRGSGVTPSPMGS